MEPNLEDSSVDNEPHCGQRIDSWTTTLDPRTNGAGGLTPCSARALRASGDNHSVVQAGDRTVRTSTQSAPAALAASTMSSRMASIAGQPE